MTVHGCAWLCMTVWLCDCDCAEIPRRWQLATKTEKRCRCDKLLVVPDINPTKLKFTRQHVLYTLFQPRSLAGGVVLANPLDVALVGSLTCGTLPLPQVAAGMSQLAQPMQEPNGDAVQFSITSKLEGTTTATPTGALRAVCAENTLTLSGLRAGYYTITLTEPHPAHLILRVH
jgi:hypothetical protein